MKILLALLLANTISNTAPLMPINNEYSIQENQNINADNSVDALPYPYSDNVLDYVKKLAADYIHNYAKVSTWDSWVKHHAIRLVPGSMSIKTLTPIGEGFLTNEKLISSTKYKIHQEEDLLENDTDQTQSLKSDGFSRKYTETLTHTVTKSNGVDITIPLKFATFRFAVNTITTDTQTSTMDSTITSPEQTVVVPPHSKREVKYTVYENDKVYNYNLHAQIPWNTIISFKVETPNHSPFSHQYLCTRFDVPLGDIIKSTMYSPGGLPSNENSIYVVPDRNELWINSPLDLKVFDNELEVVVSQ